MRESSRGEEEVVSFDIGVKQVAPHVAAALFPHEIAELEAWLDAREKLQEHLEERPDELTLVDVLPALLKEAAASLSDIGKIDGKVKTELKSSIHALDKLLDQLRVIDENRPSGLKDVGRAELIKAKLDVVKMDLSKTGNS
jgi:hypothetical protein